MILKFKNKVITSVKKVSFTEDGLVYYVRTDNQPYIDYVSNLIKVV